MVVESSVPLQDVTFSYHRSISEKYGEGVAKLCHKVLFYCTLNKEKGRDATVYLSARKLGECLGRSTRSIRMYFAAAREGGLITTKKYYKDGFLVGNLVAPTEKLLALGAGKDCIMVRKEFPKGGEEIAPWLGKDCRSLYIKNIYNNINTPTALDAHVLHPAIADATGVSGAQNEMMKMIKKQAKTIQLLQEKLNAFESTLTSFHNMDSPSQDKTTLKSRQTPLSPDISRTDTPRKTREAQTLKEKQFDEWYQLYPRKVSKEKAREAFGKALKKIRYKDLITMTKAYINANETQETLKRENGKFIPHPTTWLDQERWEDYRESLQRSAAMNEKCAQLNQTSTQTVCLNETDRKIHEVLRTRIRADDYHSWFVQSDFHFSRTDSYASSGKKYALCFAKGGFTVNAIQSRFSTDLRFAVEQVLGKEYGFEIKQKEAAQKELDQMLSSPIILPNPPKTARISLGKSHIPAQISVERLEKRSGGFSVGVLINKLNLSISK